MPARSGSLRRPGPPRSRPHRVPPPTTGRASPGSSGRRGRPGVAGSARQDRERSVPPVPSITTSAACSSVRRRASASMPSGSLATRRASPEGKVATSRWSFATCRCRRRPGCRHRRASLRGRSWRPLVFSPHARPSESGLGLYAALAQHGTAPATIRPLGERAGAPPQLTHGLHAETRLDRYRVGLTLPERRNATRSQHTIPHLVPGAA